MSKRRIFEVFEKGGITCVNEGYLIIRNRKKSIQLMDQLQKLPKKAAVKIFVNLSDSEIKNENKSYPEDLESYLYEKLLQFSCFLKEKCSMKDD